MPSGLLPFRVARLTHFCGSLLVVAASASAAAAQTEKRAPGTSTLTVEGCLARQAAVAGAAAQPDRYLLTLDQPAAATNAEKQPRSGATPAPPHRTIYVLRVADGVTLDLAAAANRKVRITGTSTAPSTSAPLAGRSPEATPYQAPVATPSDTSRATGTPFDTANLPTLVVQSMAVQPTTCQ
jgi:hypothetical protein